MVGDKELYESVLDALESVKPPSKYKEIITYFLIGLAGGCGLGILIAFLR